MPEPRMMQGPADAHPSSEHYGRHAETICCEMDETSPFNNCRPVLSETPEQRDPKCDPIEVAMWSLGSNGNLYRDWLGQAKLPLLYRSREEAERDIRNPNLKAVPVKVIIQQVEDTGNAD